MACQQQFACIIMIYHGCKGVFVIKGGFMNFLLWDGGGGQSTNPSPRLGGGGGYQCYKHKF